MTNRCRWLLVMTIAGLLLGMFFQLTHFAILNLTFVFWIGVEWFLFRSRVLSAKDVFSRVERIVDNQTGNSLSLSLDQKYEVALKAVFEKKTPGLRFFLTDQIPGGIESNDRWPAVIDVNSKRAMKWKYSITPRVTGKISLPGIQLTITDKFCFFRQQKFVKLRQDLTLLPFMLQPKSTVENVKSDNIQLLAGHHRFKRPGVSSELLGIREYRAGDPPRSIAWKATARSGKLMTCEYESEVPIRTTLIADVSGYQFWGRPGPSPFDSIASAVCSITRLLTEDKDPVGAVFVSGVNKTRIAPGLGQRQLVRVLQTLLNSHPGANVSAEFGLSELEETAWRALYRIYPELLSEKVNRPHVPWFYFGSKRRYHLIIRKQVALALNWIQGGSTSKGHRMAYDEQMFRAACDRFFAEYPSVANSLSLVANYGAGRLEKEKSVTQIAKALIENVARAKDNELFVLVGDFGVAADAYQQLLQSVRVARANFHRVMLVSVPPREIANCIDDQVARQAFEYMQSVNKNMSIQQVSEFFGLGATFSELDDVNLLEKVVGELRILKAGGARGPVSPGVAPTSYQPSSSQPGYGDVRGAAGKPAAAWSTTPQPPIAGQSLSNHGKGG